MQTQLQLFEFDDNTNEYIDDKYTAKIPPPLYQPSDIQPHILELVDVNKTKRLIRDIENSNLDNFEKRFLIEAAHRHSVFNYSKIADYYAHASKEMQTFMEKSALVIIDFDKAIEYGYVQLSENIKKIQHATGERSKKA